MKRFLLGVMLGLLIGWTTIGYVQASDNDARTYKELLRKIISIIEQVQKTSQIIADNTTAIRKKLGAE